MIRPLIVRFLLCLAMLASFAGAQNPPGFRELKIGDPAPDFKLIGVDDKVMALADFKDPEWLAVVFTSNHCPVSHAAEPRLIKLYQEYRDRGFGVVAINPNHPDGLRPDELGYSKYGDSFPEMKLYAKEMGFPFPFLYDGETQSVAMAYGCLATPHVFLFDRERKLRYKGWIDDCRFPGEEYVTQADLRNAVAALIAGKPVPVEITRPIGCSTKWRMKNAEVLKDDAKWAALPVAIDLIDAAGVIKLRANRTDKYRLINVWSTTCAPCIEEFPGLVRVARRMGLRPFEWVTISTDLPEDKAKAEAFLKKHHAGLPDHLKASLAGEGRSTNSYLYTEPSMDPLIKALDPEWAGPQPHTVLIAPGGEIVFRHNGKINGEELLDAILKVMTPFYQPDK
ncbi:MAG: redoxin domain-containing protein [Akkermansiaceae bacterium]|nr:redoxin domain-containing protein [Akkermansiaceae bacterium]MCF7730878.1 redoxin domain-containing protein [Akkermansiaceae bacterium]